MYSPEVMTAIRVHLNAINVLLELLEKPVPEQSGSREPECPLCGCGVSDVSLIGTKDKEYQCASINCTWRGKL